MGVDLDIYRMRIGMFNRTTLKKMKVSSFDMAIVVFGVSCGALSFILTLLIQQGIEPNPGPWTLEAIFPAVVAAFLGMIIMYMILKELKQHGTNDRTNFALMCRLLLDVCGGLLRELLKAKTAPATLVVTLQRIQQGIPPVYKKQLYPPGGFKGSYENLDVSILCSILRNLGSIPPHRKGWGRDPDPLDNSLSANIDRIRCQRNEGFGHVKAASMSDRKFKEGWDIIRHCVEEIQNSEPAIKTDYLAEMDKMKKEAMDFKTEHRYIEQFRELQTIAEEIKESIGDESRTIQRVIGHESQTTQHSVDQESQAVQQAIGDESRTIQRVVGHESQTIQQAVDQESQALQQAIGEESLIIQRVIGHESQTMQQAIDHESQALQRAIGDETQTIQRTMEEQTETLQESIAGRPSNDNPVRRAMIDSAKSMVKEQSQKSLYVATEAFQNAKDKLCTNGVVVIKGNTGDGKTRLAIQLLAWIMDRGNNQAKDPIELRDLNRWEGTVDPKSNVAVYIDDLFHDNTSRSTSMNIFENRKKYFESTFSGDKNIGGNNFLIVIVRNDDFISLNLESDDFFKSANVVDLSKTDSISREDKLDLLRIYKPVTKDFKEFDDKEKEEILKCAPPLGFAQCCVLYRDVSVLQSERVDFFRSPFHFMKTALSKLDDGRCAALLYLFLCGGEVLEKDLGPSNDKIDKTLLEEVFDIDLVEVKLIGQLSNKKKIQFIHKSLDCLSGSLVTKEKLRGYDDDDLCYRFSHDSVKDTVALLYGDVDLIGFIQNCHYNSLCYITSKNTPNKIFIDPDNYKHVYSRFLRELKCKLSDNYECIASIDILNDSQFMSGFFRWLDSEGIDKDIYLKWTTKDVDEPYDFYTDRGDWYYSKSDDSDSSDGGNKYRGDTCFPSFLVYVAHSNNIYLLNQLLEKTPKDHPQLQCVLFGVVRAGHIGVFNMLIERGINPTVRAKKSQSPHFVSDVNVLHEACLFEREEMVTKLTTKFPFLVQDTCGPLKLSILHVVVDTGNCSLYDTVETIILGDLSREDRVKRLSEMIDGRGMTVLCYRCNQYDCSNTMALHLFHKYPELVSIRDECGCHCLHWIAFWSNKDLFIQVDSYLQNYYKDKGINYDMTAIIDDCGYSVLDWAKIGWGDDEEIEDMCSYLSQFWS